jgi:hypothetical protein
MTSHTTAAGAASDPDPAPRALRTIGALALLVLAACAPPAAVRGADRLTEALPPVTAPETTRTVAAWSGGETVPDTARLSLAARSGRAAPTSTAARTTHRAAEPITRRALLATPWVGSYSAGRGARPAALGLTLRAAGGDAAPTLAGEMTLWAVAASSTFDASTRAPGHLVRVPLATTRVADGRLMLVTEPFHDPACGCTVHGTFVGELRGDTLSGRFTLAGAPTLATRRGAWELVRRTTR